MKNRILFIVAFLFIYSFGFSQQDVKNLQDPQAKKVLDEFALRAKKSKATRIDFTLNLDDRKEKTKKAFKGVVTMKGERFRLETPDYIIFSDGKEIYNYLKSSNEVNISKVSKSKKDEDIFLSNPTKLFTMYKKDYKYQYIGKETIKGKSCFLIDLFPFDLNRKYSRIRLVIDVAKYELVTAISFGKSGTIYEFNVDKYNNASTIADAELIFDKSKYPNVEVVDMRF